jgi:hypothetical protein
VSSNGELRLGVERDCSGGGGGGGRAKGIQDHQVGMTCGMQQGKARATSGPPAMQCTIQRSIFIRVGETGWGGVGWGGVGWGIKKRAPEMGCMAHYMEHCHTFLQQSNHPGAQRATYVLHSVQAWT